MCMSLKTTSMEGKLNKDGEIAKDPRGGGKINTSKQWLVVDKPLRERGYGIGK